jgi:hypothetical protein
MRRLPFFGCLALALILVFAIVYAVRSGNAANGIALDLLEAHGLITAGGKVASLDGNDSRLSRRVQSMHFRSVSMSSFWIGANRSIYVLGLPVGTRLDLSNSSTNELQWISRRSIFVGNHQWQTPQSSLKRPLTHEPL